MQLSYGTVDTDYAGRLATWDPAEDGPIWMVNLMRYHQRAQYADGDDQGLTGREADDRYAPVEILTEIGARVAFFAEVEQQLLGAEPVWDRVAVVEYPTRRSFIEMQSRRDFRAKHEHKQAGMERTIVMGCVPIPGIALAADTPSVPWDQVPHPPSDDDGPVMVIHVLQFDTGQFDTGAGAAQTPAAMAAYQNAAAVSAAAHGVRIAAWFAVEGTIVGDGRRWNQVRFNEFPSRRAFMAVVSDPARLEAQRAHREVAVSDTYTLLTRSSSTRPILR